MDQKKQGQGKQDGLNHDHTHQAGTPRITADLSQSAGQAASAVEKTKDQVADAVSDVAHQATETVSHLASSAKQQVSSQIDSQKLKVSETLTSVANALRQTGTQLRTQNQAPVADYTHKAADQVERVSTFLRDHEISDILHEAEQFARRSPALFLGGAFALGLLGARFLKSSSQQRQIASGQPMMRQPMMRQPMMRQPMYDQGRYSANETHGRTMSQQNQQYGNRTAFDRLRNESSMANSIPGMTQTHTHTDTMSGSGSASHNAGTTSGSMGSASNHSATGGSATANRTGMGTTGTLGNTGDRSIEYGQSPKREDD